MVSCKTVEDLKKLYPNSFDRLGSLKGAYNIRIGPSVKPAMHARRKVPIESKEAIDHDANLINLLNVCQKEELVLNSKKLELRRERVTFFGAEYSAQGMHPDPKKVQGITEMTAPTDKQQLQSFLGMVNYMGTFIPNLSHHTEPLRAMLKKDNVFHWEDQQTRSFQQVKTLIAKANTTPLRYYDRNLPVTVQADASLRGLGACLIQKHEGKDPADHLCQQEPHGRGDEVCQHRT